jgi:membrane protein DedA with SNARE-associated domain
VQRGSKKIVATLLHWFVQHGYLGLFSLLVLGIVGAPFPDEVLLIFAGALVAKGDLELVPTIAVAFCGSMSGITLSYIIGRTLGLALLHKYGYLIHLTADQMERVRQWFERWGKWSLMVGYFIPGVRHLTAYMAGTSQLSLVVFTLFAYTGACIWSATFIAVGYAVGEGWQSFAAVLHRNLLLATGLVMTLGSIYVCMLVRRRGHSSAQ